MEIYWFDQMANYIQQCIQRLPLPTIKRLQLMRAYHSVAKPINKLLNRNKVINEIPFEPLIYSNKLYGNEYLLHRYAGIDGDLFAIIEHGLYFGNNTKKIPSELEWELGCILTYGEYRKKLINQIYPDYYCEAIGAPILYADSEKYQKTVKEELQISGEILLFFPAHGLNFVTPIFEIDNLSEQLLSIARDNSCNNIIISTYSSVTGTKLYHSLKSKARDIIISGYSCGTRYDQEFLNRQKALISLSKITASNSLGSHVGYCVGLQRPHVILKQEITYEGRDTEKEFGEQTRSTNWEKQYMMEQDLFEKVFPPQSGQLILTDEQYKLCDYYWGFSKKKTPEEIREIFQKCHEYALEFVKCNRGRK